MILVPLLEFVILLSLSANIFLLAVTSASSCMELKDNNIFTRRDHRIFTRLGFRELAAGFDELLINHPRASAWNLRASRTHKLPYFSRLPRAFFSP
jgi:hypothetical protein